MWPGPGVWFAGPVAGVPGGGGGRTLTRKTRIMIIFFFDFKATIRFGALPPLVCPDTEQLAGLVLSACLGRARHGKPCGEQATGMDREARASFGGPWGERRLMAAGGTGASRTASLLGNDNV